MKINCLSCGHMLELDEAYSDYAGPVRCFICRSFLDIRTKDGKVRSIRVADRPGAAAERTQAAANEAESG